MLRDSQLSPLVVCLVSVGHLNNPNMQQPLRSSIDGQCHDTGDTPRADSIQHKVMFVNVTNESLHAVVDQR